MQRRRRDASRKVGSLRAVSHFELIGLRPLRVLAPVQDLPESHHRIPPDILVLALIASSNCVAEFPIGYPLVNSISGKKLRLGAGCVTATASDAGKVPFSPSSRAASRRSCSAFFRSLSRLDVSFLELNDMRPLLYDDAPIYRRQRHGPSCWSKLPESLGRRGAGMNWDRYDYEGCDDTFRYGYDIHSNIVPKPVCEKIQAGEAMKLQGQGVVGWSGAAIRGPWPPSPQGLH
jgi:hypothetical protein